MCAYFDLRVRAWLCVSCGVRGLWEYVSGATWGILKKVGVLKFLWAAHFSPHYNAISPLKTLPIRGPKNGVVPHCRYLPVFLLATFADWMTGPYIYALYDHYGYTIDQIGTLFVAGFGSSLVFGTVIGSMGDKHGRKKSCCLYVTPPPPTHTHTSLLLFKMAPTLII